MLTAHGTKRAETRTDTSHRKLCERPVCTRKRRPGAVSAPRAQISLRPSLPEAPVICPPRARASCSLCGPPGWRSWPLTTAPAAPGERQPASLASRCLRSDPEHPRTDAARKDSRAEPSLPLPSPAHPHPRRGPSMRHTSGQTAAAGRLQPCHGDDACTCSLLSAAQSTGIY